MDLSFSPRAEAFRAELRAWLAEHAPREGVDSADFAGLDEEFRFLRNWQRKLAEARWVGVHWPERYGGRGAGPEENYLFQEEMAAARAPEVINRIGVNLVGPSLMQHGTEEQRRRYLARILSAEDVWCQLFSEPGAGSDLTALRTRAVLEGDDYVVTGQKVWTSWAQYADYGILIARTDPDAPKARGISYMIVDMHAPGVEVRPLRQMTGSSEFNEVFLDNVRVPRANLVGEENRGWEIAQTTLAHERGTSPRQLVIHRILLEDLVALARARGDDAPAEAADGDLRQRIAQAAIEVEIAKLNNWRTLTRLTRGAPLGPESSFIKLYWSEMSQRIHDTVMHVLGMRGALEGGAHSIARGRLVRSYLYYRAASIFAGTSEVQRNIIAQRVLGLPR
ncbi:MAG TPA: acyl-CoA dehydrogenase family protein [Candidatus Binatia bacterium]|nr:acyl-CoA dehydrogenase family protein [Candidatus Binatia bacterium]